MQTDDTSARARPDAASARAPYGPDYSTLSLEGLKPHKLNSNHRFSDGMGSGCFMDPPGLPSYFIRDVYTARGDDTGFTALQGPDGCVTMFVDGDDDWSRGWNGVHAVRQAKLRKAWRPLPLDHIRVKLWIRKVYGYFKGMYLRPDGAEEVSKLLAHKFVPAFTEPEPSEDASPEEMGAWREAKAESDDWPVDRYRPVTYIQKFYPEFEHSRWWLDHPGYGLGMGVGDWWERYSRPPKPEECPGHLGSRHPTDRPCPCQFCGAQNRADEGWVLCDDGAYWPGQTVERLGMKPWYRGEADDE